MLRVLDCFAGIGGFSLGLERTGGFETAAFCEIEPFCQKVLNKHWPDVPIYDDIREVTSERLESDGIGRIDVITGGFPCQDLSVAGKQAGLGEGTRSGLWSELARIIGEVRPQYAIMENVTALISGDRGRWFGRVLGDLAEIGYDAEWHCIPASELGAHHHRDRVWIIAYPNDDGSLAAEITGGAKERGDSSEAWEGATSESAGLCAAGVNENVADSYSAQRKGDKCPIGILAQYADFGGASGWTTEPKLDRVADGIPDRAHRLKAIGNAVVPQIPELIGRAILANESHH